MSDMLSMFSTVGSSLKRALYLFGVTNDLDFLILALDVGDCGGEDDVDKLCLFLFLSICIIFADFLVIDNFNWGHGPRSHIAVLSKSKGHRSDGTYGLIKVWSMTEKHFMVIGSIME